MEYGSLGFSGWLGQKGVFLEGSRERAATASDEEEDNCIEEAAQEETT